MAHGTLRDAADAADAARFVGRSAEVDVVRELLHPGSRGRVLYVHGPGGIGKSALLRAAGRIAADAGLGVAAFDARDLPGDLEAVVRRIRRSRAAGSFLIIDEVDALGSQLRPLRDRLLGELPDSARLVLAGRREPDRSWREDGIDAILVELPLRPLSDPDAARLLRDRGMGVDRIAGIVRWARGYPLALTVAATAPAGRAGEEAPADLEQRLTAWLAGRPILDVPAEVLEVAALARVVDARLLAAALPGRATRASFRDLAALPVVERSGDGVTLHTVLAAAIADRLRQTESRRAAELVRRIAQHLATRARLGDIGALIELSRLIRDDELRRSIGNEPSDGYYADAARPGELEEFARANGFANGDDWPELLAWSRRRTGHTIVMRRAEGSAVMFASFVTAADLPDLGPVCTGLAAAVRETGADPRRSFAGIVLFADASAQDRAEAARLGTGAFMRQHGVADLRSMLIHYPAPDRRPPETAAIARPVPGSLSRPVAVSDFGPTGAVGFVEAVVLAENGFAPPPDRARLLDEDDDPERIERLTELLDRAFDTTPAEQRLRRTIELVHLGSRRSEEECLRELFVSRRSWYRLLRAARERILSYDEAVVAEAEMAPPRH